MRADGEEFAEVPAELESGMESRDDSSVGEYSVGRRGPSVFLSRAVVFYLFRKTVPSGEGIQCGEEPEVGARL